MLQHQLIITLQLVITQQVIVWRTLSQLPILIYIQFVVPVVEGLFQIVDLLDEVLVLEFGLLELVA